MILQCGNDDIIFFIEDSVKENSRIKLMVYIYFYWIKLRIDFLRRLKFVDIVPAFGKSFRFIVYRYFAGVNVDSYIDKLRFRLYVVVKIGQARYFVWFLILNFIVISVVYMFLSNLTFIIFQ